MCKFKSSFCIIQKDLKFVIYLLWYRRTVLEEVAQYTSLCSEKFREVQNRVEASLEAIRPNQEYKDFTEKHKYVVNYDHSFSYLRAISYGQAP
jgi:hypothetical protein